MQIPQIVRKVIQQIDARPPFRKRVLPVTSPIKHEFGTHLGPWRSRASEDASIDDFKYPPLDHTNQQIRLLRLKHREFSLEVFEISDAPPYTALSYVWGPVEPKCRWYTRGQDPEFARLDLRKNLHDFLERMENLDEKEPSDEYLWIDQISIDQSKNSERNHQVQMMSKIYSQATSVIVWLGKGNTQERHVDCPWPVDIDVLKVVLDNVYFERLWTVQEFILAKRVRVLLGPLWILCGDSRIPWAEEDASTLQTQIA
jgi:hypothetical protein